MGDLEQHYTTGELAELLDRNWTEREPTPENPRRKGGRGHGQYWDRTSDPSRVKRVLSR